MKVFKGYSRKMDFETIFIESRPHNIDRIRNTKIAALIFSSYLITNVVRGDRDSRANLMPIYGDLYQIKL